MANTIFEQRLANYSLTSVEDEQQALKEILQELVLYALSNAGFFDQAAFHGGTALRILHQLPRFSEDLDFVLNEANKDFNWRYFFDKIMFACEKFGVEPEVVDKSKAGQSVQKMFLKDNSIGKLLNLQFHHNPKQKFRIKLEIDINPPKHFDKEVQFLDFPTDFSVVSQDLASSFSGKLHALLCRAYLKGRDWFDFLWYLKRGIKPNLKHLKSTLIQQGPWAEQKLEIDMLWLEDELKKKIRSIDWNKASDDVRPFLGNLESKSLSLWSEEFFVEKAKSLNN